MLAPSLSMGRAGDASSETQEELAVAQKCSVLEGPMAAQEHCLVKA